MAAISKTSKNSPAKTPRSRCLCAAVRKAGRVLTRIYGQYLKPSGLEVTQYSMLANIARNPGITVSELAELLVMDQTTVTRNLRVLDKLGYIHLSPETTDHRIKRIRIADVGAGKMIIAEPLWEKAQMEMEKMLGRENIEGLLDSLAKIRR